MKKLASAILAAFVLGIGSQGVVSAAAPLELVQNGPVLVMLDDAADDEVEEVTPAATEQAEEEANESEPAAEEASTADDTSDASDASDASDDGDE